MDWVELSRDEWARNYLTELFKGASIELAGTEGAKLSFFRIETTGDCALAKKGAGQPRPMFELRIDIDWKVEQKVDSGRSIFDAKGQMQVSSFSSEDSDDPQVKLVCDQNLPPGATPAFKQLLKKLQDAVKDDGLPKVKKMLSEDFVAALKKQV
mmetsp:Transcript_55133/g.131379  ORF Transcript_55133/g.131379 Transcript_55133/m.131379 type:complete len:154 (+) Transcript_55133:115-576(+)